MPAERISVTTRPSTAELIDQITNATHLPKSDVYNLGVDVLHFLWSIANKDGVIGVKFPGDTDYKPVNVLIPGMIQPFKEETS